MSKTAVLVLCYAAPKIIDKLIGLCEERFFKFYLHVDSKLQLEDYTAGMLNAGRATFIQRRIPIFWGGFRMIEAQIALAKAALGDSEIDNVVLISDDTAPLRSPESIYGALREKPDRITCMPNGRPRDWYEKFFFPDSKFSNLRTVRVFERFMTSEDFEQIRRMDRLHLSGKKPLKTLYFGRQWWALSRSSLSAVITRMEEDSHLTESFRFSLFPDETFFQTTYRLCFPDTYVPKIPTYAEYNKPTIPWIFASAQEIREREFSADNLFIRKIKPDSPEVIDDLASNW